MKITEVAGFIPREFWGLSATQTFDTRDQFKKAAEKLQRFFGH